jgi:hypothetical protein
MTCAGPLLCIGLAVAADELVHQHVHEGDSHGASKEVRKVVKFPAALLQRELAHMREHLAILGQLQMALSKGAYGEAADLAEKNLGMSSLPMHGAQEVAKYMPPGMRDIGTELHRAASRFAIEATNAGATGDVRPAIAALSDVTQRCVACHAAYRFR